MHELRITGLGCYLPKTMYTNAMLPFLDPPMSVEDMDRIGILRRGIASDEEGVAEMAIHALEQALEEAQIAAETLDFIIFVNWTERRHVPDFGPRIQQQIGARRAFCFDVCGACSGFVYGVSLAHGYLQNPRFSRGAIVASDRSSRLIRPQSRGTLVFGDAAAAAVVERDVSRGARLLDYELRTDGSHNDIMDVGPDGYLRSHIKQKDLNALAGRSMAEVSRSLLTRNKISFSDLNWLIPHSGTAGVQAMVAEHMGIAREKILTNLPEIGNVTTASIPAALHHFRAQGKISPGDLVLSASVGLGWQSVAMLYTA